MVSSKTGGEQATGKTIEPDAGIAEKVRFWEEQDRINQVLIPRVIHLHKLLTDHIKENDNLPEVFRHQLDDALEKQSRRFEAERKRLHKQYGAHARHVRLLWWLATGAFVVSLTAIIVSLWA